MKKTDKVLLPLFDRCGTRTQGLSGLSSKKKHVALWVLVCCVVHSRDPDLEHARSFLWFMQLSFFVMASGMQKQGKDG